MKWSLFRRGRQTAPALPEDDAVHKKRTLSWSKSETPNKETNGRNFKDDNHQPHHHDDRTEVTQISSCDTIDSPVINRHSFLGTSEASSCCNNNTVATGEGNSKNTTIPLHIDAIPETEMLAKKERSPTRVRFSSVEVRVYKRIVGDHPDVPVPLGIGWDYEQKPRVDCK